MAVKRVVSTQDYDPNTKIADYSVGGPGVPRDGGEPAPVIPPDPAPVIPPTQPPAPVVDPNKPPAGPTPTVRTAPYNPAAGWDVGKLNDPNEGTSQKYLFGRAAQDYTGGYGRNNLQGLVDFYNQQGGHTARVVGEDLIDFGEDYGPVDIINGETEGLQWLVPSGSDLAANKAGAGGGAAADSLSGINGAIANLMASMKPGAKTADDYYAKTGTGPQPGLTTANGTDYGAALRSVSDADPLGGDIAAGYRALIAAGLKDVDAPDSPYLTGEDDLTKQTGTALGDLIKYQQGKLKPPNLVPYFEGARMPYEMARRTQLNNARGELANRGLLSEPGHLQGPEVGAVQRVEEGLAPAYTGAIADRLAALDALDLQQQGALGTTLGQSTDFGTSIANRIKTGADINATEQNALANALSGASGYSKDLGYLALGVLGNNRLWNAFVAQFGLDSDQLKADIDQGNVTNYLHLIELWLQSANISAGGFI
jgi:hypothetical protein